MSSKSRISKSLKNVKVALVFYLVNLILQFFYRKIFLSHLGAEVLGLNTTAMNLLQFLNLAELGVGAAVSYSLYKPLANRDEEQINEIVSVQGYLYNRIGLIVLAASFILMLFFPVFFSSIKVPIWYAYTTFGVLLVSALIGYFLNYQQIVLVSDQKEYKLSYATQGIKALKVTLQILFIYISEHGYIWWLILELLAMFAIVFGIKYILRREYPWLKTSIFFGKNLLKKHPEITRKTKQLFAHKIAGFAINESSPLIIFAYTSLSFIASYGNYQLIILGVTVLLASIFNSINAGVGNLVSEEKIDKILHVFEELFTIRFFLASIACYGVYKLTPVFITYWVGKSYLLADSTLILMVLVMFIGLTRLTVDSFINAYGLFRDIAAPVVETIVNLGFSIALGYFYGINGVLIGVMISLFLSVLCWKPFFLFSSGFFINVKRYFIMYAKLILITVFSLFLTNYLTSLINIDPYSSIFRSIIYGFASLSIFSSVLLIGYLMFTSGMRQFYQRFKMYLK